jgi:hypothetical protein
MFEKYYFGTSVLDLDLAAEFSEAHRARMGFVGRTGKLDIWYLPIGEFYISDSLPDLHVNHQRNKLCGQVILHPKTSDTFWHAAIISHSALYRITCELLGKEEEILLYLSRRRPITDFDQIGEAMSRFRATLNLQAPELMAKQFESIMPKLPALCGCCGKETGTLRAVPDKDYGVCQCCFNQHYRICGDCQKIIPLEEVKYDGEDILCVTCLTWAQGMGFR